MSSTSPVATSSIVFTPIGLPRRASLTITFTRGSRSESCWATRTVSSVDPSE